MKIIISLHNSAGEIGREEIDTYGDPPTLHTLIELSTEACDWLMADGDVLRIAEA